MAFINTRIATLLLLAACLSFVAFADDASVPALAPDADASVPALAPDTDASAPAVAPDADASAPAPAPAPTADSPVSSISATPAPAPGPSSGSLNYIPFDAVQDGVAVPMDEQAKDSQFLETNMANAANKMELFLQNVVEKRQKDSSTDESTQECLIQCAEEYNNAVNSLKRGLVSANAKDFVTTGNELTALTGNIDTCDDCFGDSADPEFQKFDEFVRGIGNECLEKISKYVKANTD